MLTIIDTNNINIKLMYNMFQIYYFNIFLFFIYPFVTFK